MKCCCGCRREQAETALSRRHGALVYFAGPEINTGSDRSGDSGPASKRCRMERLPAMVVHGLHDRPDAARDGDRRPMLFIVVRRGHKGTMPGTVSSSAGAPAGQAGNRPMPRARPGKVWRRWAESIKVCCRRYESCPIPSQSADSSKNWPFALDGTATPAYGGVTKFVLRQKSVHFLSYTGRRSVRRILGEELPWIAGRIPFSFRKEGRS